MATVRRIYVPEGTEFELQSGERIVNVVDDVNVSGLYVYIVKEQDVG